MKSILVRDSFTLFFYPFRISQQFIEAAHNNSIWRKSDIVPDASFFFPHIQSFFTENISKAFDQIDSNQLITYEIKNEDLTDRDKEQLFLYKSLFSRTHEIDTGEGSIEFSFIKGSSILSPKLFIIPLTQIGILTYGIKISQSHQTLDNLQELNYRLRVFSSGHIQEIMTLRNDHPAAQTAEAKIEQTLTDLQSGKKNENANYFKWSIPLWIDELLRGFSKQTTTLSPGRLQGFVYAAMDEFLDDDALDLVLFRLRRMYSAKYLPSASFMKDRGEISQTFEQVVYGASTEGAVVLVKKDEKDFLINYWNTVVGRTIWSYLLVYHQRLAMIAAAADTDALFRNNREPDAQQLSELIDRISKVQLKCLFKEVSHYTQQNEFYYLAVRNLRVDSLFHEVKDEVEEMNKILTEKWREQDRASRKREEEKSKTNQRKIEVLLALLILPQIWLALLSTNIASWQSFINENSLAVNIINGSIWVTVLAVGFKLLFARPKNE